LICGVCFSLLININFFPVNKIAEVGAEALATMLKVNNSLEVLDLRGNFDSQDINIH
jgi:hypothetical protein